ncbi:MAG TPA: M56 family metallopeptidase [Cyclobacteriaceae bacterium]
MNTLFSILTHPLAEAIGWTLVHSLWQGLVVVLLAKLVLHCIPANRPNVRYAVALSGLALILLGGVVTASLLLPEQHDIRSVSSSYYTIVSAPAVGTPSSPVFVKQAAHFIEGQMPLILTLWMTGVLFFTLRLALGWAYISRLRATAVPVADPWRALLEDLKKQFGITRDILLSESHRITAPAVVGFFKPVILVPVGMFTGLSQQQVEAVLLHELSHIRRHDFLINTLQSLLEVLYFFNPFVWMLSSAARNEREYCCDDQVVNRYHPRVYAEALAYLETVRLNKPVLVLSLTGETNNLLYRIQRFMEKSKRSNPVPQWMIPVVLAVAGVISMSWLTIGDDPARDEASRKAHERAIRSQEQTTRSVVLADTIGKPTEKRAVWSRKKTVTIGEDGQPHEEVVETFEGDEDLRDAMKHDFNLDFDYNFNWNLDSGAFTWQPDSLDFDYDFNFEFDSLLDPHAFHFDPGTFHFAPILPDSLPPLGDDVRAFREEFEKMFKDRFSDFYKEHGDDLENMMDRLQEKFNDGEWQENFHRQMQEMQKQMERLKEEMKESRMNKETFMHQQELQHRAMEAQRAAQTIQTKQIKKPIEMQKRLQDEQFMAANKQIEMANRQMQAVVKKQKALQGALREELIKDGYLDKNEPLHSLRWSNDDLQVNGKKVKPKDARKYKKLQEKLLSE